MFSDLLNDWLPVGNGTCKNANGTAGTSPSSSVSLNPKQRNGRTGGELLMTQILHMTNNFCFLGIHRFHRFLVYTHKFVEPTVMI